MRARLLPCKACRTRTAARRAALPGIGRSRCGGGGGEAGLAGARHQPLNHHLGADLLGLGAPAPWGPWCWGARARGGVVSVSMSMGGGHISYPKESLIVS